MIKYHSSDFISTINNKEMKKKYNIGYGGDNDEY